MPASVVIISPAERRILTRDLGVTRQTVSNWASGRTRPSPVHLRLMLAVPQLRPLARKFRAERVQGLRL